MSSPSPNNAAPRFTLPPPRTLARFTLVAVAVIVVVALIIAARSALAPFIFGAVLAYLLLPIVNRLNVRMPRWGAILIVYAFGLLILIGLIVFLVPPLVNQIVRLIASFSSPADFDRLLRDAVALYETTIPPTLQAPIEQLIQRSLPALQENLATIATAVGAFLLRQLTGVFGLLSVLVGFLIVPIWLFYVLNDSRRAHLALNRTLSYRARADFWNAWEIIDRSLSAYVRGQLTLGVIIGVALGVGLAILDLIPGIEIDFILVLAIWAGIAELIPMIGALLGGIPAVVVTFFVGGPVSALVVLGLVVVIQLVENNYLVPRVIGESVGVHPAILIVMLVVFGQAFGFIGVIFAAPATAIARDLYLYAYRRLSGKTPTEAVASISKRAQREAAEQMQS